MSIPQITKKLGIGIVVIILLFLGVLAVTNLEYFDEELSPEVSQILAPITMPADQDNAYIAVWGLAAANDKDMIQSGRALIQRYRSNRDTEGRDELTEAEIREILNNDGLDKSWQAKIGKCHYREHLDCTAKLAEQIAREPIANPRLDVLMARYQQIKSLNNYQHMPDVTFASLLTRYGPLLSVSKLSLANALNSLDPDDFIENLNSELTFWRMLLSQGDTILDKTIANVGYRNSLAATSSFLSTKPKLSKTSVQQLKRLLAPLSQDELDISEAFAFEGRASAAFLLELNNWLVQPNATLNAFHECSIAPFQELGKLDTEQFAHIFKNKNSASVCFENTLSISFSTLYNIGGKPMITGSSIGGLDYLARIHDLNGMIGLVGLELSLLVDKATAEQWLKDNQTLLGHRIRFDNSSNILEFDCLEPSSTCKIKL